jgi:peptide/nickel transport system permease protein
MASFIIKRLLWAVFLVFVITFVSFIIFYLMPAADPAVLRAGKAPTPELIAAITKQLGLDQPWYVQYWKFVSNLVTNFDLGYSYQNQESVRSALFARVPATASLVFGAAVIWLVVGISIGVISALKRHSFLDRFAMGGALVAISAPVYWLGLVAIFLFTNDIGKFPVFADPGTYTPITTDPLGWLSSLLLPWLVLATAFSAIYARFVRSGLSETLKEDYIRTARAKGLKERTVVRQGLRAAITPVVTLFGMDIGILMGGAILTETVFNIPGVGRFAFQAIENGDLPSMQGVVLIIAIAIVLSTLLVDIAYAIIDPRVRY